jgi:hypothetical protein
MLLNDAARMERHAAPDDRRGTVRGLTDEGQVMETLKLMRLDEAQCELVYDVMAREALEQGLTMWKNT